MVTIVSPSDLPESITSELEPRDLQLLLDGLNARASRLAPCLADSPTDDQVAEARVVLVGTIQRWAQAGAGAFQAQTAGPFSMTVDTRERGGYTLRPSEIAQLQEICETGPSDGAFSIDTAPRRSVTHLPWCNLAFGADWCSCGADIAGYPIYETDMHSYEAEGG